MGYNSFERRVNDHSFIFFYIPLRICPEKYKIHDSWYILLVQPYTVTLLLVLSAFHAQKAGFRGYLLHAKIPIPYNYAVHPCFTMMYQFESCKVLPYSIAFPS
jgi:hypothetical protein